MQAETITDPRTEGSPVANGPQDSAYAFAPAWGLAYSVCGTKPFDGPERLAVRGLTLTGTQGAYRVVAIGGT
jgi:hypothetical protein